MRRRFRAIDLRLMPMPTAITVVLCTYNGAAFLREQLESLAAQTRRPDELIVSDDASTDDTLALADDFAKDAPFPVCVHAHSANLGFIGNFERGIALAGGDIIALCDQDDVWRPNKLAVLAEIFESDPKVGLAFSNGDVVDDSLRPLGQTLFQYAGFSPDKQAKLRRGDAIDVMLDANVVTGATLAFRSTLRETSLPIPRDTGRYHDAWIALVASALSEVDFAGEPLILYRQHSFQVTGVRPSIRPAVLGRDHYRGHAEFLELLKSRLESAPPSTRRDDSLKRLTDRLDHVRLRANLASSRAARVLPVLREALSGRYSHYSSGVKSILRDLLRE